MHRRKGQNSVKPLGAGAPSVGYTAPCCQIGFAALGGAAGDTDNHAYVTMQMRWPGTPVPQQHHTLADSVTQCNQKSF